MTETAVTMTVCGSIGSILTLVFGEAIQALPSLPVHEKISPPRVKRKTQTELVEGVNHLGSKLEDKLVIKTIVIEGLPPASVATLNQCVIERIVNHVKDAYIRGEYDDKKLEKYCKGRNFCFCMAYTMQYDKSQLIINFYVSHTNNAPAWVDFSNCERLLTPMLEDAVNRVTAAFTRQCERALRSYTNLVYNYAITHDCEPEYYMIP